MINWRNCLRKSSISAFFHKRQLGAIALLTITGILGNYCNLSLFFGVDFLFGSISALISAYYFGWIWGGLAGLIAGSVIAQLG